MLWKTQGASYVDHLIKGTEHYENLLEVLTQSEQPSRSDECDTIAQQKRNNCTVQTMRARE